jgi:hypothetical protein
MEATLTGHEHRAYFGRRMGFRFYRRVRLFPGLSVNLSRLGPSLSVGVRGAHVTVGRRGVTRTVGLPGTGIFWTSRTGRQTGVHSTTPPADVQPSVGVTVVALLIVAVVVLVVLAVVAGG